MSEWREVSLSNHIDLISGYAFKSKDFLDYQENGTFPVIKIKNVANGDVNLDKVVYHKYNDSLSKYLLSKGDVLIAMTGNHPQAQTQVVGAVSKYKLDSNSLLNQRVGKIIPLGDTELDFVYYFFKDKDTHRYLANESSGSANQANISKATIVGIKTDFPEPEEQKAIAEVLSSLDDKIDLLHRQNKTLEQMAETLFRQWFVEEAQEDWEEIDLSEYIDFKEGPGIRNWQYTDIGVPFINIRLIQNGDINIQDANCVSFEEGNGKYSHFHLEPNDMVMSTSGTLGRTAIVREYHLPMILNTSVIRFKPHDGKTYSFMYQYLNSSEFYEHLISNASGSVQLNFGPTHLKRIKMYMPPIKIVNEFCGVVDSYYLKIKNNQTKIRTLESLRDTLLPKLMSGEVRIASNG